MKQQFFTHGNDGSSSSSSGGGSEEYEQKRANENIKTKKPQHNKTLRKEEEKNTLFCLIFFSFFIILLSVYCLSLSCLLLTTFIYDYFRCFVAIIFKHKLEEEKKNRIAEKKTEKNAGSFRCVTKASKRKTNLR